MFLSSFNESVTQITESPYLVTDVVLSGTNVSSDDATDVLLDPHGAPVYTCERWLQVIFKPAVTAVTKLRFWVPDFVANDGWTLRWGPSYGYETPSPTKSRFAVSAIPDSDPDVSNLDTLIESGIVKSQWIVLQGRYLGSGSEDLSGVADLAIEIDCEVS